MYLSMYIWGQKEKRASEDEMAGWHNRWNGHQLGQTPGDGEGQGGQVCCSPWGREESYATGRLNNNPKPGNWVIYGNVCTLWAHLQKYELKMVTSWLYAPFHQLRNYRFSVVSSSIMSALKTGTVLTSVPKIFTSTQQMYSKNVLR